MEKKNNQDLARKFIQSQPKKTIRIFVFSSAKEANRYVNILQAHHLRYGVDDGDHNKQGGVYLCSRDSYKKFLDKFIHKVKQYDGNDYLNQDFGILFHEGSEKQSIIEAILTDTQLKFKFIDLNDSYQKIRYQDLVLELGKLIDLNYEEPFSEPGICIKRWNPRCIVSEQDWINDLEKLFPEPYTGEAYHCVCFKNLEKDNPESKVLGEDIRTILLQTKYDLEKNSKELGIQSIWFGRRSDLKDVYDPKLKGRIKISNDYDYLFLTKFNSQEEMEQYYEKEVHGKIRSDLYEKLGDGLKFLCGQYADNKSLRTRDKVTVFEDIIEELVSHYMIRHDFSNIENIKTIVLQDNRIPFDY